MEYSVEIGRDKPELILQILTGKICRLVEPVHRPVVNANEA
jgi:hypothetical protein